MTDYDDMYLIEIERRNKKAISESTGYDFERQRGGGDDVREWFMHMGNEELTDPEANNKYNEVLRKRKGLEEVDGWLGIEWR